jgi:Uma2 family endonuclease
MASAIQRKAATYEDLLAVPDDKVAEILDGELFASPRPALRHANAASALGGDVIGQFHNSGGDRPGGWWILFGPEMHQGEDVVVPDMAGWRMKRLPAIPDAPWLDVAPDWACEIVSPSTESIDRGRKLRIYAREGVAHVWLVNPIAKTLEVYRLSDSNWLLIHTHAGNEVVRAEPFEVVPLEIGRWWLPEARPAEP